MKVAVIYVQYKGYEYESYIPITDMYMGMVEKSLAYRQFSNKCYYWNNMEFLERSSWRRSIFGRSTAMVRT